MMSRYAASRRSEVVAALLPLVSHAPIYGPNNTTSNCLGDTPLVEGRRREEEVEYV